MATIPQSEGEVQDECRRLLRHGLRSLLRGDKVAALQAKVMEQDNVLLTAEDLRTAAQLCICVTALREDILAALEERP